MMVVIDLMEFVGADLDNPEKAATVYEMGSALTFRGTVKQFDRFVDMVRKQMEKEK